MEPITNGKQTNGRRVRARPCRNPRQEYISKSMLDDAKIRKDDNMFFVSIADKEVILISKNPKILTAEVIV